MTSAAALRERASRQGFTSRTADTVAAVARSAGLQAQDLAASRLAMRVRTTGLTEAAAAAVCDDGAVVRTWLMRATLHAVPAADVRWLLGIFGPRTLARYRSRRQQLGLADGYCAEATAALGDLLTNGPATRAELVVGLAAHGLALPVGSQPAAHLLIHAASTGAICRGPDRGREATYVPLDAWVPASPGPADPERELVRRYFAAFGPATAADFASWSGLPAGLVTPVYEEPVEDVEPGSGVALLPAYDTYLLGHRDRAALLGDVPARLVYAGGVIHPTVVRDGRVVGTWRLARTARELVVHVDGQLRADELRAEVEDLGRFYDRAVRLELVS